MPDETIFQPYVDLPVSIDQAFAYHDRPGALQRLMPPWEPVVIESSDNSLAPGSRVVMKMSVLGIPSRWVAEHTKYEPPDLFEDIQVSGPFAAWKHQHRFSTTDTGSRLVDAIRYRVPLGAVGSVVAGGLIRNKLSAMFNYRHAVTKGDLGAIHDGGLSPQKVAVSGATGLVGTQLCALLSLAGHHVSRLVRSSTSKPDHIYAWGDAEQSRGLGDQDAIIHLAGESIASSRWNDDVKKRIRDSRVIKTRELCERLAAFEKPPKTLLCASATGIFGDRGDTRLDEQAEPGDDFLAKVAAEWEAACQPAVDAGIRVVHLRFGIILSPRGGALEKMLTPTKLFAGGPLGGGGQWWSWIAIDDVVRAIYHCLARQEISGAVNFVAPEPVTNREFAKVLGRVLGRPAIIPAPAFALRLALGEMADALLLASTRVEPTRLLETEFKFQFPTLEPALRHLLGKNTEVHELAE